LISIGVLIVEIGCFCFLEEFC